MARLPGRPALWPLGLGVLAAAGLLLSGAGTRLGLWDFRTGFSLLRFSAWAGLAATACAAGVAVWRRREARKMGLMLAAGAVLGGLAALVPFLWRNVAKSVPVIHDISTDTDDPPAFVELLAARRGAPNPSEYGGPAVAAAQKAAYPEIKTLELGFTPAEAFEKALAAARRMGWEVLFWDLAQGRIEAVATTFWFGFKDDVVIRVRPSKDGSRVDIRSVSRVGRGDVGTNARRIRHFMRYMENRQ